MAGEQEKEIQQLKNRFRDLAEKSFSQNIYTFTGFLGLSEQDTFWRMEEELRYCGYSFRGGKESADRKVLRFGNSDELGYDIPFPIVCIHIEPLMHKFAEQLSHRDFLGALMNLGIERSTLGDLQVGDKEAYLFCLDSIAEYICTNLSQVRHTHVKCSVTERIEDLPEEEPKKQILQVASARADAVISKVYQISRGDCLELFRTGKIFINGRQCENNSRQLKDGEVINARGFGKFIYVSTGSISKKGKLNIEVAVYV